MRTLLFLLFSFHLCAQHGPVFPEPKQIKITGPAFRFQGSLLLEENEQSREVVDYFHAVFEKDHQIHLELSKTADAHIRLKQIQTLVYSEGYSLFVTPEGIDIQYAAQEGLIHALHTLLQLVENQYTITGVEIEDEPAFSYRGAHLDCSRHFFTLVEIKTYIDQLAKLKFNRFHWHLTDDQGWRIEIKKYPLLTEIGAWRDSTLIGHFSKQPIEYKKEHYGGFYTQDEARELVRYARIRGIEVIPEIEMPGHASAAIAAYPELSCEGKRIPVVGTWGVFDDVFCCKASTRAFLKDVLDEVMDIFPYPVIHIGGDECPKVKWKQCAACQTLKEENGLKDEHELQSFFIKDIEKHVNEKGKKIIGWDEILEGGLAPNAQVMSWQGVEGGIKAAQERHEVVMTPTAFCYFDYYQSGHPLEPLAIGGYVPLQKVYSFDPLKGIEAPYHRYILGAQANLWTEYVHSMKAVQYQVFPRLVALSEVVWNRSKAPYSDFVQRLASTYLPRLSKNEVNYSTSFLDPILKFEVTEFGMRYDLQKSVENTVYQFNQVERNSISLARTDDKQLHFFEIQSVVDNKPLRNCHYQFTTHLALGKRVDFTTMPHEKYNHNGAYGLTDGIVGSSPWKGNEWLGFDNDTICFTLDLDKKILFNEIEIGTLNDPGSWIYRPLRYELSISSNGKKFKKLASGQVRSDVIQRKGKAKARYIRVYLFNYDVIPEGKTGAGFTPWTFVNEVIITR